MDIYGDVSKTSTNMKFPSITNNQSSTKPGHTKYGHTICESFGSMAINSIMFPYRVIFPNMAKHANI